MSNKDLLNKLKALFSNETENEVNIEKALFIDAVLEDGTKIQVDTQVEGELSTGDVVYILDEEGNVVSEAPDGEHSLEGGEVVVVTEAGKIVEIKSGEETVEEEDKKEEESEEEMSSDDEEEEDEEEKKKKEEEMSSDENDPEDPKIKAGGGSGQTPILPSGNNGAVSKWIDKIKNGSSESTEDESTDESNFSVTPENIIAILETIEYINDKFEKMNSEFEAKTKELNDTFNKFSKAPSTKPTKKVDAFDKVKMPRSAKFDKISQLRGKK